MTPEEELDPFTREFLEALFDSGSGTDPGPVPEALAAEVLRLKQAAAETQTTTPILELFEALATARARYGAGPDRFSLTREALVALCRKHAEIDEHGVTVGGRLQRARPIVAAANTRVKEYLQAHPVEAPSGLEIWDTIQENMARIRSVLGIDEGDWGRYTVQIRNCIDSAETLARIVDLPEAVIRDVTRVTAQYRMRLTPYYASLIRPGVVNDPVLLQSVPTAEMVDNVGVEIPPVAADHSPARLIDQFYPRTVTIKATNMCAMYCTHCLRIAHIGKRDRVYPDAAYQEAFNYIRANPRIRDVLVTGGDAFVLPNRVLAGILKTLDEIDHVRLKRLGTRIPVTAPYRIDSELLDILSASNAVKPVRVVTQINTAQEMTPVSAGAFKRLSAAVSAVLNQAVLLRGVNDSRVKMWKLCETIQENYVRPYYIFNCSYRNPQFAHFRVPVEKGRDIVESMYGNISGDAIPRYIATAGGKIPLHRSNVLGREQNDVVLKKPWSGEEVRYPDPDPDVYEDPDFSFSRYWK
ncbi:MAG: KamA family radical SAM protein [Desulfobacterales bacterium]|jgi:lysine 2,3-aminomutase